jgi:CubicO group peptidase (beta-lactamase class C family)
MRTTYRLLFVVLTALAAAPLAPASELPTARPGDVGLDADKIRQAHDAVRALIDKKEVAGAVVAVARKGKVVVFEALGESEAGSGKAMKTDAIVRIYSMTKPVTTVAALILVEDGKVALDDPVSKYLPEFKGLRVHTGAGDETVEAKRDITVRDLMRHTSGLTYGVFGDTPVDRLYKKAGVLTSPGDTLQDMMTKLGRLPLLYQPGTRWHYGVSTDVLGRVVEVASGKGLNEFFAERIFKPLDMRDSGFFVPEEKLGRFAAVHGLYKDRKLTVAEAADKGRYKAKPKLLSGGGGCVSTARDYLRFCQMLLNGGELDGVRLLRKETVAAMTRNQLPEEAMRAKNGGSAAVGDGFGLGFGVRVGKDDPEAGKAVGEFYWGGAASTHFWIAPKQELVVVALEQFMPSRPALQQAIKPLIYQATGE